MDPGAECLHRGLPGAGGGAAGAQGPAGRALGHRGAERADARAGAVLLPAAGRRRESARALRSGGIGGAGPGAAGSQRARCFRHHGAGLVLPERGRESPGVRPLPRRQRTECAARAGSGHGPTTGSPGPARPSSPGSGTGRASSTLARRFPGRFPRTSSITTEPSISIGWGITRLATCWSSSRQGRSTGPAWPCRPTGAGSS